jgi:hypothetical protein
MVVPDRGAQWVSLSKVITKLLAVVPSERQKSIRVSKSGFSLGQGLAQFGCDQFSEMALYIVPRFSNHAGSHLGFTVAATMSS